MFLLCWFLLLFKMYCMYVLMFLKAKSVHIPNNQIYSLILCAFSSNLII